MFITSDCQKELTNYVPYVPINYRLSLSHELNDLGVGQLVTITADPLAKKYYSIVSYHNARYPKFRIVYPTAGNGIILYRTNYSEYQAFDRTCTYNAFTDYDSITVDGRGDFPICMHCKSVFILSMDGMPSNSHPVSKATNPLMQYNVVVGLDSLFITN